MLESDLVGRRLWQRLGSVPSFPSLAPQEFIDDCWKRVALHLIAVILIGENVGSEEFTGQRAALGLDSKMKRADIGFAQPLADVLRGFGKIGVQLVKHWLISSVFTVHP